MTHDTARQFWTDYIKLACAGDAHVTMPNQPYGYFLRIGIWGEDV